MDGDFFLGLRAHVKEEEDIYMLGINNI